MCQIMRSEERRLGQSWSNRLLSSADLRLPENSHVGIKSDDGVKRAASPTYISEGQPQPHSEVSCRLTYFR